jgi:hypothetical protein
MHGKIILEVTDGTDAGQKYEYTGTNRVFIGRQDDCGIVLYEKTVSRYHCILTINPPTVRLQDFGSLNGTFINGKKIGQRDRDKSPEEAKYEKYQEFDLHDGDLIRLLAELTAVKTEYDRVAQALEDVRTTGYSVVLPDRADMTLEKPELTKKGAAFGVRLRASAPSIHMIRVDADAQISPMVGSEDQSRDLLTLLSGEPDTVWDSNLFGRSVYDMVRESLGTKLLRAAPEVREKFRQSLSKIINEGAQGMICILL